MADESAEAPAPRQEASPRRLSSGQRTLILGLAVVVAVLLGAGLATVVTSDERAATGFTDSGGRRLDEVPDSNVFMRLPDMELAGFAGGDPVDLEGYRGRPLVVNFWATWCAPCVEEMPDFQEVAAAAGEQVAFLGVNERDAPSNAQAFVQELGISYDLAVDAGEQLFAAVEGFGMPTTLLVTAEGMIVYRHTGPLERAELEQLLADHLSVDVSRGVPLPRTLARGPGRQ